MQQGTIFDIKKYALQDGPGIRTTIFFKGCPLACAWCHNPEGIRREPELMFSKSKCIACGQCAARCAVQRGTSKSCTHCLSCTALCPAEAKRASGRLVGLDELMHEILKDRIFYQESSGGVTFSGGEPLLQSAFLLALLESCRREGIHTAVDTCGYAKREIILEVARFADLFLFDIKHWDPAAHQRGTGVTNELILDNMKQLAAHGHRLIARLPLIAGYNDDLTQATAIAAFLSAAPTIDEVTLLPYHALASGKLAQLVHPQTQKDFAPLAPQQLSAIHNIYAAHGLNVTIGG